MGTWRLADRGGKMPKPSVVAVAAKVGCTTVIGCGEWRGVLTLRNSHNAMRARGLK